MGKCFFSFFFFSAFVFCLWNNPRCYANVQQKKQPRVSLIFQPDFDLSVIYFDLLKNENKKTARKAKNHTEACQYKIIQC